MELFKFLFCIVLIAFCSAHCPESDTNLLKWSDHAGTWSGSPPAENDNLTITQPILLDEQPPTLYSIVITATGKLVWDPNTVVHLKVHWVQVDGELHIGAEDCPFLSNTHITFLETSFKTSFFLTTKAEAESGTINLSHMETKAVKGQRGEVFLTSGICKLLSPNCIVLDQLKFTSNTSSFTKISFLFRHFNGSSAVPTKLDFRHIRKKRKQK
ncbi:unnamed protein product [Mytilus coruscus]|uniref:G8 domain-containing protein n=1 Tax=Mytilus coruscus TaxID=42192 RepID=A0A6J8C1E0_MYTCO|nr:unnamed protein product [Mytilus coruscus]